MFDENNPPPVDSLDEFNRAIGPTNGAPPEKPSEGNGFDPMAGYRDMGFDVDGDAEAEAEAEDDEWELWTPLLAKHYDPPAQRWAVEDFYPAKEVSLLTGEGEIGKTTMLQQLQVSSALGQSWLGMEVTKGPTLGIFCEDGEPQLWRRFKNALTSHGADWGDAEGKMFWTALRSSKVDTTLFHFDGDGGVEFGEGYGLLVTLMDMVEPSPSICILDSLYDFFPYNINDPALAKAFVKALGSLGQKRNCAFIINSHPTKSGIDEGTGQHGARTWHNAVRGRAYIEVKDKTDPDSPRIVNHMKNSYGPKRKPFAVRYDLDHHVYVVDEEATEDAKRITGKAAIALDLLRKAIDEDGETPQCAGTD